MIVLSAPESAAAMSIDEFITNVQAPPFLLYIALLASAVTAMLANQERYGHRHVAYYVLLCSLLGSVTVMACKGVSTFVNLWASGEGEMPFGSPVFYALALVLGSTAVLQIRCLVEAMERFGPRPNPNPGPKPKPNLKPNLKPAADPGALTRRWTNPKPNPHSDPDPNPTPGTSTRRWSASATWRLCRCTTCSSH